MKRPSYYVRAHTYRGVDGWQVGSRGLPWNVSIFVRTYAGACEIRNAYRVSREAGEAMTNRVFDREAIS